MIKTEMDWQWSKDRFSIAIWPWTEYPSCYGRFWPCFHYIRGIEFIIPITKVHSFHFFTEYRAGE